MLHITIEGLAAGATAGAIAYTVTSLTSDIVAKTANYTIKGIGLAAAAGTKYWMGSIPSATVSIACEMAAKTSEDTLQRGGLLTSAAVGAAVGAATALTVTIGSHLVSYTIHYSKVLSKEMAIKLSELYIRQISGVSTCCPEDDWELVELLSTEGV
jgi:hypothetical protein